MRPDVRALLWRRSGVCGASFMALALALACGGAHAEPTEIQMPTPKGFVAFTVEGQWPVLSIQTKYPVASAAFRIPHSTDADSPDTSNIVIAFYDLRSEEARTAYATPPKQYGAAPPVPEARGGWALYRQVGQQGDTPYTIVDAKRARVAGVAVSVRMVWPRRGADPAAFDADMERALQGVLQSVHVGAQSAKRP